jgi:predicted LPLAT superfamily acyltransferase
MSHVKEHMRQTKSGKIVAVRGHDNSKPGKARYRVEIDDMLEGRKSGVFTSQVSSLDEVRAFAKEHGKKGAQVRIWDTHQHTTATPHKTLTVE